MLNNLTGWHFMIALGLLVTAVLVLVVIFAVASRMSRRTHPGTAGSSPDAVERIHRLGQLRDDGLITDAEYDEKRAELLDRI
ncbi:MAG TPA: SHOCT domain-containing protein [Glaciibacter sp.]|nr:SHOCT domain-containing protein [Glaciibacter sp.]